MYLSIAPQKNRRSTCRRRRKQQQTVWLPWLVVFDNSFGD
jgi:hypothetical protein